MASRANSVSPTGAVARVVDVAARVAAGLEERGHEQDAVVALAGDRAAGAVDRRDLGGHVPAQRRVAAADDLDVRVLLEQPAGDRSVSSAASASGSERELVKKNVVGASSVE